MNITMMFLYICFITLCFQSFSSPPALSSWTQSFWMAVFLPHYGHLWSALKHIPQNNPYLESGEIWLWIQAPPPVAWGVLCFNFLILSSGNCKMNRFSVDYMLIHIRVYYKIWIVTSMTTHASLHDYLEVKIIVYSPPHTSLTLNYLGHVSQAHPSDRDYISFPYHLGRRVEY